MHLHYDSVSEGRLCGGKFSGDMMDQFIEFQKRYSESFVRMEAERYKRRQVAISQWRQEAMEHQKALFGVFANAMTHCNNALNAMLKAKHDAENEIKKLKAVKREFDSEEHFTAPTQIVYTTEDSTDDDNLF